VPETSGEFSATVTKLKIYLKNVFLDDQQPLILLACGGYASISKEMLELIAAFQNRGEKLLNNLILMGAIRENFPLGQPKAIARALVFGIFPWQFTRTKKLSIDTSWETFLFGPSQEKYFFAEGSILLTQPKINKQISLRAVFLKKSLQSEVELIVATTYAEEQKSAADILESYLYRWPEPLDSYQDYLKKIEYATYTDLSKLNITKQLQEAFISRELKENLKFALEKLSLYAQKYFFPLGYRGLKFEDLKEKFYNLSGRVRKAGRNLIVTFEAPGEDFLLTEDLAYACKRVNEAGIYTAKKERLWFRVG
jgi:hypothetical protein